jgi:hypothetical protein
MECSVANSLRERNWPAEQGVYFKDLETEKEREIDVISRHLLDRPRRRRGTGGPIINLSVICECKSLSAYNLVLLGGNPDPLIDDRMITHWSGEEKNIRELVEAIGQNPYYPKTDKKQLYSYYSTRAYAEGRWIARYLRLDPPPVALNAVAFRETKGGEDRGKESTDQRTASPFWSSIRSVISATRAAEERFVKTMRSYTSGRNPHAYDISELVDNDSFFFDAEVMRMGCFHPIIFCKSNLFSLEQTEVRRVPSARLFIRNLDFASRYVDIVNFDAADSYIDQMVSHFEANSSRAIRKTWDIVDAVNWAPGQASTEFARAVGVTVKIQINLSLSLTPKSPLPQTPSDRQKTRASRGSGRSA